MKRLTYFVFILILLPLGVQGQAGFEANKTEGCSPLSVAFLDTSNQAIAWLWDFGNGRTSQLQNPGIIYTEPGVYQVSLKVTFGNGEQKTILKKEYIRVVESPTIELQSSQQEICLGDTVGLSLSDENLNSPLSEWQWDFGDGVTSNEASPSHLYTKSGFFNIGIVVKNELGCQAFALLENHLQVAEAVNAEFTYEKSFFCDAPAEISFTSVDSISGLIHFWDFGDGNNSTQINPTHIYSQEGNYEITHIIEFQDGCNDTVKLSPGVSIGTEKIDFTDSVYQSCVGQSISLQIEVPEGTEVDWSWGDGSTETASRKQTHIYREEGNYLIEARLKSSDACEKTVKKQIEILPSPIPQFTVSDSLSCETPFNVNFSNQSEGADFYLWDLGEGTQSSAQNPTHAYINQGVYSVSLTAFNHAGCSASVLKENLIIKESPEFEIVASGTRGCAGQKLTRFSVESNSAFPIVSWLWDFGDGNTSSAESPEHIYEDPGQYDLSLIAVNAKGCTLSVKKPALVKLGKRPNVSFAVNDTETCLKDALSFTNTGDIGDEEIWDFGDGWTTDAFNPSHIFLDTGWFDITLIVGDRGCYDTLVKEDLVRILPPRASFLVEGKLQQNHLICELAKPIQFTSTSIGADTYSWDFGNGFNSTEANPEQKYFNSGTYPVVLKVKNKETGCEHETSSIVKVEVVEAYFKIDTTLGCNPLIVHFKDSSKNAVSYFWDLGNGQSFTHANPKGTYGPGTYDVSLTIAGKEGCKDTIVKKDLINVNAPSIDFTADKRKACAPGTIQFTAISDGEFNVQKVIWDWGDGSQSEGPISNHTYTKGGRYTVTLRIIDDKACESILTKPNYIYISEPVAAFSSTFTQSCLNKTFTFQNESSGIIKSYFWEFGDGNTSTSANPDHLYDSYGVYDVNLVITDDLGCKDSITGREYIKIRPLKAEILTGKIYGDCPPIMVNFESGNLDDEIASWYWNFGDRTSSKEASPGHLYTLPGKYDITLGITDMAGCTDTITLYEHVIVDGPAAMFDFTPREGCPGVEVQFSLLADASLVNQWDMDDGTILREVEPLHSYNNPGEYFPKILLRDASGCEVLIVSPDPVTVFKTPLATFEAKENPVCLGESIKFSDRSTGPVNIVSWNWNLGDGTQKQSSAFEYQYLAAGKYDISLAVIDARGCQDSILKNSFVQVLDTIIPDPAFIHYASVSKADEVKLVFGRYGNSRNDFHKYLVFRSEDEVQFDLIAELGELRDTIYYDKGLNTEVFSYCYKVLIETECGMRSPLENAPPHCTILASATAGQDEILLDWSEYKGWKPDQYLVYRVKDYDTTEVELLASVDGNTLSYLDKEMNCYDSFTYRVKAIVDSSISYSWSNISTESPRHTPPQLPIHMKYASVIDDKYIHFEWEAAQDPRFIYYDIYRTTENGREFWLRVSDLENTKLDDFEVLVDEHSYAYTVLGVDTCRDVTPYGREAKSILLDVKRKNASNILNWSAYKEWDQGVAFYQVELWNEAQNRFNKIGQVSEDILTFTDAQTQLEQARYCYRVLAFQRGNTSIISFSNEDCVDAVPIIYAPNAFTPNADGLNDRFVLKGVYISKIEVKIFSRWGMLIHESQEGAHSWDGFLSDGSPAPEGVYTYVARATGFDGQIFQKAGTVTLIR